MGPACVKQTVIPDGHGAAQRFVDLKIFVQNEKKTSGARLRATNVASIPGARNAPSKTCRADDNSYSGKLNVPNLDLPVCCVVFLSGTKFLIVFVKPAHAPIGKISCGKHAEITPSRVLALLYHLPCVAGFLQQATCVETCLARIWELCTLRDPLIESVDQKHFIESSERCLCRIQTWHPE